MSFDMGPMNNLSNVQKSAKTCSGGGGNTGYFARGKKDDDNLVEFSKDYPDDSFEKVTLEDLQEENSSGFFDSIVQFFKKIFKKIFKL